MTKQTTDEAGNAAAASDSQYMINDGKAILYHVKKDGYWVVTSGNNTLSFPVRKQKRSWHNFGRWRYDFWFIGPDKALWHGYQIGDNNQVAHCKRTKKVVPYYWNSDMYVRA